MILFGENIGDAATMLCIGLAIQPALDWIERGGLPQLFQVVFGVSATVYLVQLLVKAGPPQATQCRRISRRGVSMPAVSACHGGSCYRSPLWAHPPCCSPRA